MDKNATPEESAELAAVRQQILDSFERSAAPTQRPPRMWRVYTCGVAAAVLNFVIIELIALITGLPGDSLLWYALIPVILVDVTLGLCLGAALDLRALRRHQSRNH